MHTFLRSGASRGFSALKYSPRVRPDSGEATEMPLTVIWKGREGRKKKRKRKKASASERFRAGPVRHATFVFLLVTFPTVPRGARGGRSQSIGGGEGERGRRGRGIFYLKTTPSGVGVCIFRAALSTPQLQLWLSVLGCYLWVVPRTSSRRNDSRAESTNRRPSQQNQHQTATSRALHTHPEHTLKDTNSETLKLSRDEDSHQAGRRRYYLLP